MWFPKRDPKTLYDISGHHATGFFSHLLIQNGREGGIRITSIILGSIRRKMSLKKGKLPPSPHTHTHLTSPPNLCCKQNGGRQGSGGGQIIRFSSPYQFEVNHLIRGPQRDPPPNLRQIMTLFTLRSPNISWFLISRR